MRPFRRRHKLSKKSAFTLVEILVVMLIIVLLYTAQLNMVGSKLTTTKFNLDVDFLMTTLPNMVNSHRTLSINHNKYANPSITTDFYSSTISTSDLISLYKVSPTLPSGDSNKWQLVTKNSPAWKSNCTTATIMPHFFCVSLALKEPGWFDTYMKNSALKSKISYSSVIIKPRKPNIYLLFK